MKYVLKYTVVIDAPNENMAECFSVDLEGDIRDLNKWIVDVWCDPYMQEEE
jgi:hypothetical protein